MKNYFKVINNDYTNYVERKWMYWSSLIGILVILDVFLYIMFTYSFNSTVVGSYFLFTILFIVNYALAVDWMYRGFVNKAIIKEKLKKESDRDIKIIEYYNDYLINEDSFKKEFQFVPKNKRFEYVSLLFDIEQSKLKGSLQNDN